MSATLSSNQPHDPSGADRPIVDLIRLAGHRPQPSPFRRAQARAAVEIEWHRMRRRRRVRRSLWGLSVAALTLLALGRLALPLLRAPALRDGGATGPVLATLVYAHAAIHARPPDTPRDGSSPMLHAGDTIGAGTVVETGVEGRAAFQLRDGTSLRLDIDTRIVLDTASHVTLQRGAIYIDSQGRRAATPGLLVQTPHGLVREIGTQFEVRALDSGLRIRVREGDVQLDPLDADDPHGARSRHRTAPITIAQAEDVQVDAAGAIERRAIADDDDAWSWAAATAPPFAIEGASLEGFLQWVSREEGWKWRFHDEAAARHGAGVVLHGSIDGLTPAQALDAVLPTCGMTHQLRRGELIVRLATE